MARLAIVVFLVFVALLVLRILRVFAEGLLRHGPGRGGAPREVEGEMVRDPVCGTWIDRRLAVAVRGPGGWVPVCSEKCRARLEGS
jgi:hypothetical protein